MKKTVLLILAGMLLLGGCQKPKDQDPQGNGMLPPPDQVVINNELSGTTLKDSHLQITQTAPVKIAKEIVRLTISEQTLEGCTMDACTEAAKAGLKGSVILAGTQLNPGLSVFQLITDADLKAHALTTSKGTFDEAQVLEHKVWSDGTVHLINMNNFIGRTENEDQRLLTDQMSRWVYNEEAAVGMMLMDYMVPTGDLFSDLKVSSKNIENLKVSVAYLKQASFPAGIDRTFQAIEGLSLNGDGYVVSLSFNKKGKDATTVTLPVFIIQEYSKDTLIPSSQFSIQDQTILITKLDSSAVIEEDTRRKVVDIAVPFYAGQSPAERFALAVGSKEKKKDYTWAEEVIAQMRSQLVTFYKNQIGK